MPLTAWIESNYFCVCLRICPTLCMTYKSFSVYISIRLEQQPRYLFIRGQTNTFIQRSVAILHQRKGITSKRSRIKTWKPSTEGSSYFSEDVQWSHSRLAESRSANLPYYRGSGGFWRRTRDDLIPVPDCAKRKPTQNTYSTSTNTTSPHSSASHQPS